MLRFAPVTGILLTSFAVSSAFAQSAPSCPTPPASEEKPWLNKQYSAECRARFVLAQLKTLDQKFAALRCHKSQIGDRDVETFVRQRLREAGRAFGIEYAETFRVISYRR